MSVMAMLHQLTLFRRRLGLYDNVRSRLDTDQLHLTRPLWRKGAHLEVAVNRFVAVVEY